MALLEFPVLSPADGVAAGGATGQIEAGFFGRPGSAGGAVVVVAAAFVV